MTFFACSFFLAAVSVDIPAVQRCAPVEKLVEFHVEPRDGLLLRNGKPFFWVGSGTEFGAIQSGPVALWLAWLHGYTAVSLYPGTRLGAKRDANGGISFHGLANMGNVAWYWEASRLGFLVDFFGNAPYYHAKEDISADILGDAEVRESLYDLGHYLSIDTGAGTGRRMALARRLSTARFFDPSNCYVELCREPGPNPSNKRVCDGFRDFARAKYDGDLSLANAVWRTDYGSWAEVIPRHLDSKRYGYKGAIAELRRRRDVKRHHREMFLDWMLYLQQDMARSAKSEMDDLRAALPGMRVTIDQRGHMSYNDGYASYDPETIAPSEDIFSLHYGWHAFEYPENMSWDDKSVLDAGAYQFLAYDFYRVNATQPIINAEEIVGVARAPKSGLDAMARNDIAKLHDTPWKFARSSASNANAMQPGFDDSQWDDMTVPGCWDATERHSGYSGSAWYRKRFKMPSGYSDDYHDGSRRFLIYGKGVAQKGRLWLNGQYVGEVKGWDRQYSFDVGSLIDWSGENVIAWHVDGFGASENGLRFYCHLLAHDMVSQSVPFGEKQYRQMLFSQLMRGVSGAMVWSWHNEFLRPYMPSLFAKLGTVAGVALPAVRHRRGKVAFLYGFASNIGLPAGGEPGGEANVAPYCALEFLGFHPDAYGELSFSRSVAPTDHPMLVVPETEIVSDATYEAFRKYVRAGGTALVGPKSLRRTFSRYAATDIDTFDRGKGKVVFVPEAKTLKDAFDVYGRYVPDPEVVVESGEKRERALVERVLAGSDKVKVLYLSNWGGREHPLTVRIPSDYVSWSAHSLVGNFVRRDDGSFSGRLPSQDVAAILLSAPGETLPDERRVSPRRMRIFEEVMRLNRHVPVAAADAIFSTSEFERDQQPDGAEVFPYLLERTEACGLSHAASDPKHWTYETLKGKKLVVLTEGNSCYLERQGALRKDNAEKFTDAVVRYVGDGGSLLVIADTSKTRNVKARLIQKLGLAFGIGLEQKLVLDGGYAHRNITASGCPSGPVQTKFHGKGRVAFVSDILKFQPFSIEHGDNAATLVRTLGFLLNRPVDETTIRTFRNNLFLTEADLRKIAKEENTTSTKEVKQ